MIDPLGRATEYQYYAADEANLARRGQVKRVIVPGGYWREFDYGGAGWLTRRTVQTGENSSETTLYSYDAWGRLRGIDYPRSADVSMGWDGENRRVWVEDGAGRREYSYDAWGRVREQRGCCGSGEGIEVVAVAAEYDPAGRKRFEKELRSDGSVVRTIESVYDKLGRLISIGDYRGAVVYTYDNATGRLKREDYPNGSYVEHTYYGTDNPSQVGFVWKVEHRKADGTLLIGYEYTYDLLGRVVQSVERPSGDTTVYTYTPAGRLESEQRTGEVAYSRSYAYNPDGSRAFVMRDDVVNGTHWDFYAYDEVSGRLSVVQDVWTGEVNSFVWNPEGTLARWDASSVAYARVFSYDEEGRLTKIERDYGDGSLQVAYEYGYNSDGVRVWKQDVLSQQEYRYICRTGCGGIPMRVYNQAMGGTNWASVEDYLATRAGAFYRNLHGSYVDMEIPYAGRALMEIIAEREDYVYVLIHTDTNETVVSNRIINIPYPIYWDSDTDETALVFAVPMWAVPAVIGVALTSLCYLTAMKLAETMEQVIEPGNDKLKHCLAGCFARLCTPFPPIGIGSLFEHFQGWGGAYDPDWRDDARATDIGVIIGAACVPIVQNPVIGTLLGGYKGCCERGCRVAFEGYYKGGGLYRRFW